MNVALYNSLVKAKQFLVTDKNNRAEAERAKTMIKVMSVDHDIENFIPKEVNSTLLFFLYIFAAPLGIIYKFHISNYNKKMEKKISKKNKEIQSSQEYQRKRAGDLAEVRRYQAEYQRLLTVQKNYYNQNYNSSLGFLPKWHRNEKNINGLLHYVKNGYANTLQEAINLYAAELRDYESFKEGLEEKRRIEDRHRESQEKMDELIKAQNDLKNEIKKQAEEDRFRRYMGH